MSYTRFSTGVAIMINSNTMRDLARYDTFDSIDILLISSSAFIPTSLSFVREIM